MPHTTIASLPILNPRPEEPEVRVSSIDAEDAPGVKTLQNPPVADAMDREEAVEQGIQPTHVLPPNE
jgi:hypothetical protein